MRPETGPMQFEGDWTGVFIRGDNAFLYANALRMLLDGPKDAEVREPAPLRLSLIRAQLGGLLALLASSNEVAKDAPFSVQRMQRIENCVADGGR